MSDDETAAAVVYGEDGPPSAEDDAAWVKAAMSRLENRFDRPDVRRIRMNCQCGHGMDEKLEFLRELAESSSCLEEFAGREIAREAGLSVMDGELYLQFPFCPCPCCPAWDRLDTDSWCQCTAGYSKFLFEKAFGCEVDVELLKSVKMGDEICLMKIVPRGPVWK